MGACVLGVAFWGLALLQRVSDNLKSPKIVLSFDAKLDYISVISSILGQAPSRYGTPPPMPVDT